MPLRRVYKRRYQGVDMKSGHFYKFKYKPFRLDPNPLIIFLHFIEGIHPNTGHQWRLIQAINFTYVPRAKRKRFLKAWLREMERPANVRLNWQRVLAKYPYIKTGIRRYQYKPASYIQKLTKISDEDIEREVVKSLVKDFSKRVTTRIRSLIQRQKEKRERARKQKMKQKRKELKRKQELQRQANKRKQESQKRKKQAKK